jgi:hypothetical protein
MVLLFVVDFWGVGGSSPFVVGKKKSCLEIQKTSISKPNRNDLIKNIVNSLQSIQKFNKKNDIHCKWVDSLAILILSIIGH